MDKLTGAGRLSGPAADPAAAREALSPLVAERLAAAEELFRRNLASPLRIVAEVGEFVAEGGGKRIRPSLHLLCARLCGYSGRHDVVLATVVEFIHCATLIHDDIIDEATTRRGRPSVNSRWDNSVTVLFGDYMFAKAMELALQAESLPVMEKLAEVTLRMTEGEMLQTRYLGRTDLSVEEYLDLVERKTAALFAAACELAGLLAAVPEDERADLREYGRHLGIAFQLVDDLLDLTGEETTLGKPAGSDLREGKATLAVLDLLAGGTSEARDLVACVMDGGEREDFVRLRHMLQRSGALERVRDRARFHARRSIAALDRFPEGPARRALRSLPDLLLTRDR